MLRYILVECTNLRNVHEKHFTVHSIKELFESIDSHIIMRLDAKLIQILVSLYGVF